MGAGGQRSARGAGVGDPYFPLDGNGGYDVQHYRSTSPTTRRPTSLTGSGHDHGPGDPEPVQLQPRLRRADRPVDQGRRAVGGVEPRRRRADRRPHAGAAASAASSRPWSGTTASRRRSTTGRRASSTPTTGRSSSVSRTWPPPGSRSTTIRSTRRRTRSRSRCRPVSRRVSNGVLERRRERRGWTTWTWNAREPMASYLAMMAIGEFDVRAYRDDGIRFWDAVDPDLFVPTSLPRTGDQFAVSAGGRPDVQAADPHDHACPPTAPTCRSGSTGTPSSAGTSSSSRRTPSGRTTGRRCPTSTVTPARTPAFSCPFWLELHPFLAHYQTDNGDDTCSPTGSTGDWWAATGPSDGYEQWAVDLSRLRRERRRGVDQLRQRRHRPGTRAVRRRRRRLDRSGHDVVRGRRRHVRRLDRAGRAGRQRAERERLDRRHGRRRPADRSARSPTGRSPGSRRSSSSCPASSAATRSRRPAASSTTSTDSASPWRTRPGPIYAKVFFGDPISGDSVVVHELAHQWYGDSLAVERWQHIWLNEGFATYAEWLWSEHEGSARRRRSSTSSTTVIPADDPFWDVTIGDPGPDDLFDFAVYAAGAMTLHAAAARRRRRRLLPDPAPVGAHAGGRQRHHRRVHRARRADLRPAARRPVRHVAVHPGATVGPVGQVGGSCDRARPGPAGRQKLPRARRLTPPRDRLTGRQDRRPLR